MRRLGMLLLLALATCAGPAANRPGALGPGAERGIGGTGAASSLAERGIGGTGIDTGVVGTITGFGSVILNGLEIASDAVTDVEIDGSRRPVGALKVGQVARVVASGDDGALKARTIEVHHEVSGPVQRLLPGGLVIVAGQRVRVTPRTQGTLPEPGLWVEVSGLRNAFGAILASRIDPRAPGDVAVSGRLVAWQGGWRIGRMPVLLPPGTDVQPRRVTATGRLAGGVLNARAVVPAALLRLEPGLGRLIVQAFVQARDGRLQLGDGVEARAGERLGRAPADAPVVVDLAAAADGSLIATDFRERGEAGPGAGAGVSGTTAPAASASAGAASAHGASSTAGSSAAGASGKGAADKGADRGAADTGADKGGGGGGAKK